MEVDEITPDFTFLQGPLLALGRALKERDYRFITPTPETLFRVNGRPANRYATTVEQVFGWNRPFRDGADNPLPPALEQSAREAGILVERAGDNTRRSMLRFSTLGSDLYLHSGFPTEAQDAVFFGPDSYRFAAAIDQELRLRPRPVERALDIGCGAGPGALTVARVCPSATVSAVDINDAALALCAINAQLAELDNVRPVRSDLFASLHGDFDLIVANPPYLLDAGARVYRHGGGSYGEALSVRIVEQSLAHLAPGGRLLLYTGVAIVDGHDLFLKQVTALLRNHGCRWQYTEIDPDVFGEELALPAYENVDRIAVVVLKVFADKPDV